jgi:hypothetical protein
MSDVFLNGGDIIVIRNAVKSFSKAIWVVGMM